MCKIIVVTGITGCGKSQMAVDIARKIGNAEIVNVDAVQMYKGLDIITNKISLEETQGIPHHMLGCLSPIEQNFSIQDFVMEVSRIISEVSDRKNIPILCGGTIYYLEGLLWNHIIPHEIEKKIVVKKDGEEHERKKIKNMNAEEMYEELRKADPVSWNLYHPHDVRKIRRSLEIFCETGIPQSEWIKRQYEEINPRYDCFIIWMTMENSILDSHLNERCLKMIQNGLLNEVSEMCETFRTYNRGLLQSIGIKEFVEYDDFVHDISNESENSERIFEKCLENFKCNSRRYARKQKKWLSKLNRNSGIFIVDVSDFISDKTKNSWESMVSFCFEICNEFLKGSKSFLDYLNGLNFPSFSYWMEKSRKDNDCIVLNWKKYWCEDCKRRLNGETEYKAHLKSRKHRNQRKRKRKEILN